MKRINGALISERLNTRELSIRDFAAYIGVSEQSAREYEKSRSMPRPDTIKRICNFLDVKRKDLIIDGVPKKVSIDNVMSGYMENLSDMYDKKNPVPSKHIKALAESLVSELNHALSCV